MKVSFILWPFCLDPSHHSVGYLHPKLGRWSIQAESQQQDFPKTFRELHYDKDSQQGCPTAEGEMHGRHHQHDSCFQGSFAPSKQHVTTIQTGAARPPRESVSTVELSDVPSARPFQIHTYYTGRRAFKTAYSFENGPLVSCTCACMLTGKFSCNP